jgi:hypothetical protein
MSSHAFRRWLVRLAITALRRILGVQRQHHAETPEAITHSHTMDPYRIRGPGRTRKNPSLGLFRELAAI